MVYLASDHAGFALKEEIKRYLLDLGYETEDEGAFELNPGDDYPIFIAKAAQKVALRQASASAKATADKQGVFGIVFGGSGEGEAIAANKVKGIRAAVYNGGPLDVVRLSRTDNNANVLSIGARFVPADQVKEAVKLWLQTPFGGGRHERRVKEIKEMEE